MPSQSTTGQPITPQKFMQAAFAYAPPLILEAAIRHGLYDRLADGPKSADELAAAAGISPRGARILLDALVGLEMLAKDKSGRYIHTPESAEFMVSTKPGYVGGFLKHTSSHLIPKWLQLSEVVRTGKPAMAVNQEGDGSKFFHEFVEDLFPVNYKAASALGDELKLADAKGPVSVLDLAAGSGVWGIALAQKSPQVRVTAVDWPGVLDVTRKVAGRFKLADRFRFVAGDLATADFGGNHHVATLGHILHSEGMERSQGAHREDISKSGIRRNRCDCRMAGQRRTYGTGPRIDFCRQHAGEYRAWRHLVFQRNSPVAGRSGVPKRAAVGSAGNLAACVGDKAVSGCGCIANDLEDPEILPSEVLIWRFRLPTF